MEVRKSVKSYHSFAVEALNIPFRLGKKWSAMHVVCSYDGVTLSRYRYVI